MKKISALLLVATLAVGLSSVRGDNKADVETDLKTLDEKLTEAFKTGDYKMLAKHMAEEYLLVDPRGMLHDKKKYLGHLKEGGSKVKDLKETEIKVKVFGDTGVVTGVLHVKGQHENKDIAVDYRWSRVYNKKGEEWRCVFEQHTHIVPKEEGK